MIDVLGSARPMTPPDVVGTRPHRSTKPHPSLRQPVAGRREDAHPTIYSNFKRTVSQTH